MIKKPWVQRVLYFFPLQLVWVHLSRNHLVLGIWAVLMGYVTQGLGNSYGIPYLFLDPEYVGKVNFYSFFIMGLAAGLFIMAFHITTYITDCRKFSFIATLENPFYKFAVNNSGIPLAFIIIHSVCIFRFQYFNEFGSILKILGDVAAYLLGIFIFITLTITYFFKATKDIRRYRKDFTLPEKKRTMAVRRVFMNKGQAGEPNATFKTEVDWDVETYFIQPFVVRLARDVDHYPRALLLKVFRQNHNAAFAFTIMVFVLLLVLGYFRESPWLSIPAGACVFILFSFVVMALGAAYAFFRKWTTTFFLGLFITLNLLSTFEVFKIKNYAYGLEYLKDPVIYKPDEVQPENSPTYFADLKRNEAVLNNWLAKQKTKTKPKLVILTASGGGLKATLWTFYSLQVADSLLGGDLLKRTNFISGSSGGMLGLAYLRELYIRKQLGENINIYNPNYANNVADDLLNPMAGAIAFNDLFIRTQTYQYNGLSYYKDRAYAFEQQLNRNTNEMLDKPLKAYQYYEESALSPTVVISPTIINDGRRLLIGSRPMSFLTDNHTFTGDLNYNVAEDVEFLSLFKDHGGQNLRYLTALRMSATFPYILPSVTLPTTPQIKVMDGGLRDNYGLKTAIRYLFANRKWIAENTSGVVLVCARENKVQNAEPTDIKQNLLEMMASPAGNHYDNIFRTQDFTNEEILSYTRTWMTAVPLEVINLELTEDKDNTIALSFHLTSLEKAQVKRSINQPQNLRAIARLRELLK